MTEIRETVKSTQDEASVAWEQARRPVLVVAAEQRGGRGRFGRPWWQADRALYASFAHAPQWPQEWWTLIPLVAGLAARRAILDRLGIAVDLRWPNDLMAEGAKVGGILSEASGDLVVIGCGINLWWPEPPEGAAGLLDADPGPDVAASLAGSWIDGLLVRLANHPPEWRRDEYRAVCVTIGGEVSWAGGSGRAVDVAPDGSLVVETADGVATVHAGEVRPAGTTLPGNGRQGPS